MAQRLVDGGAGNVLVSKGSEGAVMVCSNREAYSLVAPKGNKINAVGSGDSMVAGWLAGYLKYGDLKKAFRMSVAAGSATSFSENIASGEDVDKLYEKICI